MTRSETYQLVFAAFLAGLRPIAVVLMLAFGSTAALVAHTGSAGAQETETEAVENEGEVEEEEGAEEEGFTPPLFGAPERRVGAGSRDLGATPKVPCEPDAESGECPGDE